MRQLRLVVSNPKNKSSRWWWLFLALLFVPALGAAVHQGGHGTAAVKRDAAAYCCKRSGRFWPRNARPPGAGHPAVPSPPSNARPNAGCASASRTMIPQYRTLLSVRGKLHCGHR